MEIIIKTVTEEVVPTKHPIERLNGGMRNVIKKQRKKRVKYESCTTDRDIKNRKVKKVEFEKYNIRITDGLNEIYAENLKYGGEEVKNKVYELIMKV